MAKRLVRAIRHLVRRPPDLVESHADAFTDLSLRDPKALRQMLLAEARLLKTQIAQSQAEFKAELERIKKEAESAKDARLSERAAELIQALACLRRGLYRAEIARTPDRDLLDEWHEWERLGSVAGTSELKRRLAFERQEMIRSELSLRGVRMPEPRREIDSTLSKTPSVSPPLQGGEVELETKDVFEQAPPQDWLAVWETERRVWADENEQYWNEVISNIDLAVLEPVDAAQLVRMKRKAHAEKLLSDRRGGR